MLEPRPIVGNPKMLGRLRAWAEPLVGAISDEFLVRLQVIIEDAATRVGITPRYRAHDAR